MSNRGMNQKSKEGIWTFERIGRNIFRIYVTASPHSITMTSSDVDKELHIAFAFRLLRIHLYHTDSSYNASTDALDVIFRRSLGTMTPMSKMVDTLINLVDQTASSIIDKKGVGYEFEAGLWHLILNSTNTDLVFPVIYVQNLEGGEK